MSTWTFSFKNKVGDFEQAPRHDNQGDRAQCRTRRRSHRTTSARVPHEAASVHLSAVHATRPMGEDVIRQNRHAMHGHAGVTRVWKAPSPARRRRGTERPSPRQSSTSRATGEGLPPHTYTRRRRRKGAHSPDVGTRPVDGVKRRRTGSRRTALRCAIRTRKVSHWKSLSPRRK